MAPSCSGSLLLPGAAKGDMLDSPMAIGVISAILWFYLVTTVVEGTRGGGLGIQDKDANWIFTTGVTTNQYAWAHTLEYAFFAVVFTAPLALLPAVTLSTLNKPLWRNNPQTCD